VGRIGGRADDGQWGFHFETHQTWWNQGKRGLIHHALPVSLQQAARFGRTLRISKKKKKNTAESAPVEFRAAAIRP